ncbi:MAG: phenylalanine--tRNA ligase subunit beta [Bacteroidota bacterium]|nr:phenylalanine--tRNA ligase subunit beta [Bacteroidota bacterium]
MRISYNWLQRYINVNDSVENLAQKLTSVGLEVESVDYLGKKFEGFVVAEVIDVQKHPNADRLRMCKVNVGSKDGPLQIVCGAPNVEIGQKVIVGLIGAIVPHNQHDPTGKPFTLIKATIRGVDSFGMICSAKELGISEDSSGIKVLDPNAKVGTALADYLGVNDVAFELGITPNRPDCLCHIGVARDVAAIYKKKYSFPQYKLTENKKTSITKIATVKIENVIDCPRYTARVIQNVTVKESPDWLKQLLMTAGLRPINNIVDATNFVMLEYGQPLHAFDYENLAKHTIVVKNASAGEQFTTLDGKTHQLKGTELMICDGKKPVAIAGVMGGLNSEISENTKTVLLEAAYFSPTSVRKTAKRLGINSDASYRFERGIDPNITAEASARAASLIAEITGGEVVQGIIDLYPKKIVPKKITLKRSRVNSILGSDISSKEIKNILSSLEIKSAPRKEKNSFVCVVPTSRPDIEQEIDLIEEVARIYGYDNIENKTSSEVMFSKPDKDEVRINSIRQWCVANGLNEVLTNSLIDRSTAKMFSENLVTVKNPLSVDLEILRPSLLATMLQTIAYNYNHGATRLHVFEIGREFSISTEKGTYLKGYIEKNVLGICLSGDANQLSWSEKQRNLDLFDIKGLILSLLKSIGLDNSDFIYYNAPSSLTEMTIGVEINNTYVGFIGRCKPELAKSFKIEKEVFYAELNLDQIVKFDTVKKFKEFSKYPTVIRDVAFVVSKTISVGEIEKVIRSVGGEEITSVTLFDLFEGKSLGEGNKSVAYSISINSAEKTLTDGKIESIIKSIVNAVVTKFNANLRSI